MTNTKSPDFAQPRAQQIWADYMRQVDELCGLLDQRQKADIEMEIKAHLLESFIQQPDGDEESRISAAIEKLGQPPEFVPLWVEERLLDGAQPGASARNLISLLRTDALKGIRQFFFSMTVGFGYLLSFYFFLIAVLKLFFPENVGLYLTPTGVPILGYVDADEFTEILGYWLTPVGFTAAVLLQVLLTKLVNRHIGRVSR